MADNTIDIGFTVANDDLAAGLSGSLQQIASTADVIQNYFQTIANAAMTARPALVDFNAALNGAGSGATQRKAQEDFYAAEVAQVEREKALHQMSADDAIAQEIRIENEKFAPAPERTPAGIRRRRREPGDPEETAISARPDRDPALRETAAARPEIDHGVAAGLAGNHRAHRQCFQFVR